MMENKTIKIAGFSIKRYLWRIKQPVRIMKLLPF
jgi:hypothetical protein